MDSFTVYLASNACEDFCAYNTNANFSNPFPYTCKDMTAYEVALSEMTYYDDYKILPDIIDPFSPPETKTKFYNEDNGDNKIVVERWQRNTLKIKKRRVGFGSFVTDMQATCQTGGIAVEFTQRIIQGRYTNIIIKVEFEKDAKLILSPELAKMLGFNETTFTNGEHVSPLAPDAALFGTLSMQVDIGSVIKEKLVTHTVVLPQIVGYPTIASLLSEIVLKLHAEKVVISLRARPSKRLIEWNTQNARVTLSPFLTKYLHLSDGFSFYKKNRVEIPMEIKLPTKILVSCNIIRNQVYLGKEDKILTVIDRQESDGLHKVTYSPQNLLYNDVVLSQIQQIQVNLLTERSSYLPFNKYPTTVTLHFRRKLFE